MNSRRFVVGLIAVGIVAGAGWYRMRYRRCRRADEPRGDIISRIVERGPEGAGRIGLRRSCAPGLAFHSQTDSQGSAGQRNVATAAKGGPRLVAQRAERSRIPKGDGDHDPGVDSARARKGNARTAWVRDPEKYYFTIFGSPGSEGRWGWSVEGHHLSLNFVVEGDRIVAATPAFFGANPATVKSSVGVGPEEGYRTLAAEEHLAFRVA